MNHDDLFLTYRLYALLFILEIAEVQSKERFKQYLCLLLQLGKYACKQLAIYLTFIEMKFALLSFATALARRVLPHPGGPNKRTPEGAAKPIAAN